jgi:murein tripeptide amidase MpaA
MPSTNKYAQIAKAYEKYNNNNSTFNGKSLSDNRQITNFYAAKAHGIDHVHKMSSYIADLDSCQRNNLIVPENLSKPIPNKENGAMFSINMLN